MDSFLLRFLTARPRLPQWLRYVLTLVLVALTAFLQFLLQGHPGVYPLVLFIPAIFVASLAFDRGAGFLATFASAAAMAAYIIPPSRETTIPLLIFVLIGLAVAAITETLRQTVEKLADARAYADVLLRELAHRTKNDLATIVSILRLQARTAADESVKAALTSAISRVEVVARVHDRLGDSTGDQKVQLAAYLEALCQGLADLHRGVRPIAIRVQCDDILLRSSQGSMVGLIVNELVTNAFKHAFPDERSGAVEVTVRGKGREIAITVADDGVGCPKDVEDRTGTRLINLLVAQMKGSMKRVALPRGCEVLVALELAPE